jgi:hypothetical protein
MMLNGVANSSRLHRLARLHRSCAEKLKWQGWKLKKEDCRRRRPRAEDARLNMRLLKLRLFKL